MRGWILGMLITLAACCAAADPAPLKLRAWGVPSEFKFDPAQAADRAVVQAFQKQYPDIEPVSPSSLTVTLGGEGQNIVPFMQIAGEVAPDVLYVNFKQSQTYIGMKLLYPLDAYVEREAGAAIADSSSLDNEHYRAELAKGKHWAIVRDRVPEQCWPVMRRACPYEEKCPYRAAARKGPLKLHRHVWCYPVGAMAMGLAYDRSMFAEHADEGLEMRVPRDWEEMLAWAKVLTNPAKNEFGLGIELRLPAWHLVSLIYSAGGRVVEEDAAGNWRCVVDSDAGVEALYFYCRLRLEKVVRDGRTYRGVIGWGAGGGGLARYGMQFEYLDERFLAAAADRTRGIGPVPAGPTGKRGSEFNAKMCGIFAGLREDPKRREAAWNYISFFDGEEARRIRVEKMVDGGLGPFVRRELLEKYNVGGQYDSVMRQVSPELEAAWKLAMAHGVPEPYGKNCQYVYDELNRPIGSAWNDPVVLRAVDEGRPELARGVLRKILQKAARQIDAKLLGNVEPAVRARQNRVAWAVIATVVIGFAVVLRKVFRAFNPRRIGVRDEGGWAFARHRAAYLLMLPAMASIGLWLYWPVVKGTAIAFQNYSVLGESEWVGAANFAEVLYSAEFWHAVGISAVYAVLFLLFGFWTPIALAFALQEIPRGKTFYRTIYYLPAVLSGLVVIFLWKQFYAPDGLLNAVFNGAANLLNHLPGVDIAERHGNWLDDPTWALFLTLLPTVWAGLGPGCLIYLAALKTVPEELYEAADLDGAGLWGKVFAVALPSIRALVAINFIGAVIGAVRGAGSFVLAMTGGGPWTSSGGVTEVFGLKLFLTTFGYLKFGEGAAMAWVVGFMLIGFTVFQLQRLSRMEFRTAERAGPTI